MSEERVHRVLRRYDEHLTDAEFGAILNRLLQYRILRHDPHEAAYTAHPLVRNHYLACLNASDPSIDSGQAAAQEQDAHERIKDYYLELAGDTPCNRTPDDLAPLIEVVHHACRAGAYDEGYRIYRERTGQGNRFVDVHQLGAYETSLALMLEFFPDGDTSQEPQVSDPVRKSWILNAVGFRLMSLGRLAKAVSFYERADEIKLNITKDWHNASITYRNLADLHAYLGALAASADAATRVLALARRAENKRDEYASLAYQAWAAHLQGDLEAAGAAYSQTETLEREINSTERYLYSLSGIWHADHLRRVGPSMDTGQAVDYARRITEANLEICERNRWVTSISNCHRVLGDLDAGDGNHESARAQYDRALQIARGITFRPALIEALLARGRWAARHLRDALAAYSDLNEALSYALDGGYRVYEADARVALAWAHLAAARSPRPMEGEGSGVRVDSLRRARDEADRARAEATRAWQMSEQMGYHWGRVGAEEVRGKIEIEEGE